MAEPPVTPEGSLERILILGIRQSDGKTAGERQKALMVVARRRRQPPDTVVH